MDDGRRQSCNSKTLLMATAACAAGLLASMASARADCKPTAEPPICLTGTTISPNERIAIVEQPGDADELELTQGDTIADWRVVEISQKFIKVAYQGDTVEIDLPDQSGALVHTIKQGPMKRLHTWEAKGERGAPQ